MSKIVIKLPKDVIERFEQYLNSKIYLSSSNVTDHWQRREDPNRKRFILHKNFIEVIKEKDDGLSDDYSNCFNKNDSKIKYFYRRNKTIRRSLGVFLLRFIFNQNQGISYSPIVNFKKHWNIEPSYISESDVFSEYGHTEDYGIWKNAYIYNNISKINKSLEFNFDNFIEIGPGPGTLIRFIKINDPKKKFTLVDLPFNIPFSFLNLIKRFPQSSFILPNEITTDHYIPDSDFTFIHDDGIKKIKSDIFDAGINNMSFQEMRFDEIEKYFILLRRVLKRENMFYCLNAVEKPMIYDDGTTNFIRFSEYPWNRNDIDFEYNLSPVEIGRTYKPFFWKASRISKI